MAMLRTAIDTGRIKGIATDNPKVSAFLGIPYAAPPTGRLRWHGPTAPKPWDEERECSDFGYSCWQAIRKTPAPTKPDPVPDRPLRMDEDCLSINVWTPADSCDQKLPVMVWYYGGGLQFGTSDNKAFDGETLCDYGVVLVTANYRTGVFGYFGHEDLEKENEMGTSGNYGLQDQIEVLRWVKRNITAFGGDPDNITVFGVSGGGRSVQGLCCSPVSRDMIKHAAVHSAGGLNPDYSLPYSEIKALAHEFIAYCGKNSMAELREMPAKELQDFYTSFAPREFNITGDGYFLPQTMDEMVRKNDFADIDYILLTTNGEIVRPRKEKTTLANIGPDKFSFRNRILGAAIKPATDDEAEDLVTWAEAYDMKASQLAWARLIDKFGKKPAYVCTLDRAEPGKPFAAHGGEKNYIFHAFRKFSTPYEECDEKISRELMTRWTNFAKTGNPNGEGLSDWTPFTNESPLTLSIDADGFIMEDRNNKILDQAAKVYTEYSSYSQVLESLK